jgi:ADP-ribosylglycohydrolase
MKKAALGNYTGCLIGGAIGDALGAPVEFLDMGTILKNYGSAGITGYVDHEGAKGEFTDDTQMTLFTAEALLRSYQRQVLRGIGGSFPTIAHMSYLRWLYTQGDYSENHPYNKNLVLSGWLYDQKALHKKRYPGNTCISALISGQAGDMNHPINNSKGCGTIMRVAPVGLMLFGENELAFKTACDCSAITHGHPSGWLSAGSFASVISDLAVGIPLIPAIHNAVGILKRYKDHEETLQAIENALALFEETKHDTSILRPNSIEALGGAWVAEEALAIALYCSLLFESDFEKGVLCSVNHSGDSDSTGAITGNILGLINGIDQISEHLIQNLLYADLVKEVAEDVYIRMKGNTEHPDEEWFEKYPGY